MGYRSNVVICVRVDKAIKWDSENRKMIYHSEDWREERFKWFIGMVKLAGYEFMDYSWIRKGWKDNTFLMCLEDVKYYESYPDVQEIEGFWNWCMSLEEDHQQKGFSGKKIRTGEDPEDVEVEEFGNDVPEIYPYNYIDMGEYEYILNETTTGE